MSRTDARTGRPVDLGSLGVLRWTAVALAAATGLIHVYIGVVEGILPFTLAGVGFFIGILVFFSRYWRRWFYLVAAVFAAVQIVLWVAGGMEMFSLGVPDKLIQVAFVGVVVYLYRIERTA